MRAERSSKKKIKVNFSDWDVGVQIGLDEISEAAEKAMEEAIEKINHRAQEQFRKILEAIVSNGMNEALCVELYGNGILSISFDLEDHKRGIIDMSWHVDLNKYIKEHITGMLGRNRMIEPYAVPEATRMRDMFLTLAALFDEFLPKTDSAEGV